MGKENDRGKGILSLIINVHHKLQPISETEL
jgi:hypothetical protein